MHLPFKAKSIARFKIISRKSLFFLNRHFIGGCAYVTRAVSAATSTLS